MVNRSLRDFLLRNKMCVNCGLVDEDGDLDVAGSATFWYCRKHLDQRTEAARSPRDRVTISPY